MDNLDAKIEQNRKDQQRLKEEETRLLEEKDRENRPFISLDYDQTRFADRGTDSGLGVGVKNSVGYCPEPKNNLPKEYTFGYLSPEDIRKLIPFLESWLEKYHG